MKTVCISDTVDFLHEYITQPSLTPADRIFHAVRLLMCALKDVPSITCDSQLAAIEELKCIFETWRPSTPPKPPTPNSPISPVPTPPAAPAQPTELPIVCNPQQLKTQTQKSLNYSTMLQPIRMTYSSSEQVT